MFYALELMIQRLKERILILFVYVVLYMISRRKKMGLEQGE